MPRMLETSVNSVMDSASAMRIRREDDGPRWEPNAINNRMSMDNLAATTVQHSVILSIYDSSFKLKLHK